MFAVDIFKQIEKKDLPTGESIDRDSIGEIAETLDEETAGALLFEIAAACRVKGIDPESAVRRYARSVQNETEALASESVS